MTYKELKPFKVDESYLDKIEEKIRQLFLKEIYLPLLKEMKVSSSTLTNSIDDLLRAIQRGTIYFSKGEFRGKFSSATSKELKRLGGAFHHGSFRISLLHLPVEIRRAIDNSEEKFIEMARRIDLKIQNLVPEEVAEKLKVENLFDNTVMKMDQEFKKTVKGVVIAPNLTDAQRANIAKNYTDNLKLFIKKWTAEETASLRQNMQVHVFAGKRFEGKISPIAKLIKVMGKSYSSAQKKAKFLARQETNLLLAKYKEERYADYKIVEYRWQCLRMPHDKNPNTHEVGNVRYYHGLLDGKIFKWNDPPVVNKRGETKNPQEDYNCRCIAVPVIKF